MEVLKPIFYNPGRETLDNCYLSPTNTNPSLFCETHNDSDSVESGIQIMGIQWKPVQKEINFRPKVVDTLSYINDNSYPINKIFNFSWSTEEEQTTTWYHQCGICEKFECQTNLPDSGCALKIVYDHMETTSTTSMLLSSKKSLQVTIAPKKTTIVHLVLLASEITELPFVATIKSVGSASEHKIEGIWKGTLYKLSSSNINVCETELGIM